MAEGDGAPWSLGRLDFDGRRSPLSLYGSTVTLTNAGRLSAPLLSVTRSLNR
jgi:hypothetical protein